MTFLFNFLFHLELYTILTFLGEKSIFFISCSYLDLLSSLCSAVYSFSLLISAFVQIPFEFLECILFVGFFPPVEPRHLELDIWQFGL